MRRRISASVCQNFLLIYIEFLVIDIFQRRQRYKFYLNRTSIGTPSDLHRT